MKTFEKIVVTAIFAFGVISLAMGLQNIETPTDGSFYDGMIIAGRADTADETVQTRYTPRRVGDILLGSAGLGTGIVWVSKGKTTNDWVQAGVYYTLVDVTIGQLSVQTNTSIGGTLGVVGASALHAIGASTITGTTIQAGTSIGGAAVTGATMTAQTSVSAPTLNGSTAVNAGAITSLTVFAGTVGGTSHTGATVTVATSVTAPSILANSVTGTTVYAGTIGATTMTGTTFVVGSGGITGGESVTNTFYTVVAGTSGCITNTVITRKGIVASGTTTQ